MPAGQRYGGRTAEERRAERRERLLDAGLELFGTQGYANTSIEALCAATRLNPRYFYESFPTREALLRAVYDRHMEHLARTVAAALEAAPLDPRGRIEVGLRAFVETQLADHRNARGSPTWRSSASASSSSTTAATVLRGFAGLLEQEADRVAATGLLRARPPPDRARARRRRRRPADRLLHQRRPAGDRGHHLDARRPRRRRLHRDLGPHAT